MTDNGRVVCLLVAAKSGHILYERFYVRVSEAEKAEIRAGFYSATEGNASSAIEEHEYVGRYKAGVIVYIPIGDVIFYSLGTGEYDELALSTLLTYTIRSLRESLKVPLIERNLVDKYGKLCLVLDEVVNEGIVDTIDPLAVVKGTKMPKLK